ncbi:MAG: hypothetical protein IIB42_07250, partial [Candidatus Marinimicrobia bacterium]|nr:hypothetical protein [Candidatus Neomarinimicrobiota bacterium]
MKHWHYVVCLLTLLIAPGFVAAGQVTWTNTSGGTWGTGSNWSTSSVPTATDTVEIALGSTFTVTLDESASVAALTIGTAAGTQTLVLSVSANTLTVSGKVTIGANGVVELYNSTINATTVDNQGLIELESTGKLLSAVDNNGKLVVILGGNRITGPLTNAVGDTVILGGGTSYGGDLTVDSMFTNLGVVELTNASGS